MEQRITYCPACSAEKNGKKTRIALPHTCQIQEEKWKKNEKKQPKY
jgi:hypothetical protein